jgi:hypothetical protein
VESGQIVTDGKVAFVAPQIQPSVSVGGRSARTFFSGHVENGEVGITELSPEFETLDEAIKWAQEKSDVVWARDLVGGYFWAGGGSSPPSVLVKAQDDFVASRDFGKDGSLASSIECEARQLLQMREASKMSIKELSQRSGVAASIIEKIESCQAPYVGDMSTWVNLVFALTGKLQQKSPITVGWTAEEGSMLTTAISLVRKYLNE